MGRGEIKSGGRGGREEAGTDRKTDVRMQLITTAVFAVGKILRIRIGSWDIPVCESRKFINWENCFVKYKFSQSDRYVGRYDSLIEHDLS